jgi:hypothetical protein
VDVALDKKRMLDSAFVKRQLAGLCLLIEGVFEFAQLLVALATLAGGRCDLGVDFVASVVSPSIGSEASPMIAGSGKPTPGRGDLASEAAETLTSLISKLPSVSAIEWMLAKSSFFFDVGLVEKQGRYTVGLVFQVLSPSDPQQAPQQDTAASAKVTEGRTRDLKSLTATAGGRIISSPLLQDVCFIPLIHSLL